MPFLVDAPFFAATLDNTRRKNRRGVVRDRGFKLHLRDDGDVHCTVLDDLLDIRVVKDSSGLGVLYRSDHSLFDQEDFLCSSGILIQQLVLLVLVA